MSSTLGEKLRRAREERGISISEVAEQTRISPMYLESIENDNYKPLPGGIFNKGFVKAYAKYVGIDELEALQDYGRLMSQTEVPPEEQQQRYRPEVLTDDAHSSSIVPTVIFAGIILALMTGGILFLVNYIKNQPEAPAVSNANTATDGVTPKTAVEQPSTAAPVADEIRVEFRALSEKVSVTSTVDGNLAYDEVTPELPKTYTAKEGVKLRYYRGFADKIQISLNGKQVAPPPAPAKGNVEVEINKDNFARIFESGQIVTAAAPQSEPGRATAPATAMSPATVPAVVPPPTSASASTPRTGETPPRPAFTPLPTPRRSPTPIVVGRPPAARPSPN